MNSKTSPMHPKIIEMYFSRISTPFWTVFAAFLTPFPTFFPAFLAPFPAFFPAFFTFFPKPFFFLLLLLLLSPLLLGLELFFFLLLLLSLLLGLELLLFLLLLPLASSSSSLSSLSSLVSFTASKALELDILGRSRCCSFAHSHPPPPNDGTQTTPIRRNRTSSTPSATRQCCTIQFHPIVKSTPCLKKSFLSVLSTTSAISVGSRSRWARLSSSFWNFPNSTWTLSRTRHPDAPDQGRFGCHHQNFRLVMFGHVCWVIKN